MSGISRTIRRAADKIVFLGLLVLALAGAWLVTIYRSEISLGKPIALDYSNLSVRLPIGSGWQSESSWQFRKNSYTLSSIFASSAGRAGMLVHCSYSVDFSGVDAAAVLTEKSQSVKGTVHSGGQAAVDDLMFEWVYIKKPGGGAAEMFFGTALLPHNRRVEIEVYYGGGDFNFAEQVFKTVCENITFSENRLLTAGSEIISQVKSAGLSRLPSERAPSTFFLIKDSRSEPLGFSMDVLKVPTEDSRFTIQMTTYYYIRGKYPAEHAGFFQCADNFEEFYWKSELSTITGVSGYEIILESSGPAVVRSFERQPREEVYYFGSTVVPEILLDTVADQLVRSEYKEVMIDIIESDGNITTAVLSKASAEAAEETVLELRLLNKGGAVQQIYLDQSGRIYKQLLPCEGVIFERTSRDVILKNFPERLEYIQQKNGVDERNSL